MDFLLFDFDKFCFTRNWVLKQSSTPLACAARILLFTSLPPWTKEVGTINSLSRKANKPNGFTSLYRWNTQRTKEPGQASEWANNLVWMITQLGGFCWLFSLLLVSLWRGDVRIPGLQGSHRGWQEMPKCRCIQYSASSSKSKEYPRGISSHKIAITH